MHKLVIGLLGATAFAAASAASAQVVALNSPTTSGGGTPAGSEATYSTVDGTVVADGFNAPMSGNVLFFKHGGGDENGLGLNGETQNEIVAGSSFIQLNLGGLNPGSMVSFLMGSTTAGEMWQVFGTDTAGCGSACGTSILTGSDESMYHQLTGGFTYYDFYAIGAPGDTPSNVLISDLELAVPEPSTWAMMLLGFGAIGIAARRSRKLALAQLA